MSSASLSRTLVFDGRPVYRRHARRFAAQYGCAVCEHEGAVAVRRDQTEKTFACGCCGQKLRLRIGKVSSTTRAPFPSAEAWETIRPLRDRNRAVRQALRTES